ncbi:MAG: TetR/AcrR family transcriptional regulator [Microthrixaceae bacterium]
MLVPSNLTELLERFRQALRHQYEHRGVVVAPAHLIETYPEMRRSYRAVERTRYRQQREQLRALVDLGSLRLDPDETERLLANIALVARFWLAEYRTTHYRHAIDEVIDHYLALIAGLLDPYASESGAAELTPYLAAMIKIPDGEP